MQETKAKQAQAFDLKRRQQELDMQEYKVLMLSTTEYAHMRTHAHTHTF